VTVDELAYTVRGMSCAHCVHAVSTEVEALDGVESVTVDLDAKRVVVRGADLDDAAIRVAIDEAGYEAA
jgi:copper chaperone